MKGFARFPALAGAAVALGLIGGEARAEFLTQATATVNAPGDDPGSVAGSDVTLTATYAPSPGDATTSGMSYTWTLSFEHDATGSTPGGSPGFGLLTQVDSVNALTNQVPTTAGFTQPVIGYFTLGNTLYFQLAGGLTPAGAIDPSVNYNATVQVNTATSSIDVAMVPAHDLGPVFVAGSITAVPEPATVALTGLGGGLMLLVARLRRRLRRER